jgi:hypothetical protein
MVNPTVAERFWAKVQKTDDCWLWTGWKQRGYGHIRVAGCNVAAHRLAYELLVGPISAGNEIDHRTTCPKHCVNPDHLRQVTHQQNMENRAGAHRNSRSGIRGVNWSAREGKWRVGVQSSGVKHHGGYFDNLDEAREAARLLRIHLHTHNDVDRLPAP